MPDQPTITIHGSENGIRIDSRLLEERIQNAVMEGHRFIEVVAYGQHGIGGRLWKAGNEPIRIRINGQTGQRVGSMGFPNTFVEVNGPASDDVGWLNAGADIIVHGHATNGIGNAMAQGKIYVAGDIGARGMTMTKHNPRFTPPELWVLGSVGDSFAEFMAGGIAVLCGYDTVRSNVLGYRPCVGMVGGRIFFRGSYERFSEKDARLAEINDEDWLWLKKRMEDFLQAIDRSELYGSLTADRLQWQSIIARKPYEKIGTPSRSMENFRRDTWDRELGAGGLIGDLWDRDRSPIEVITTGDLRRYVPIWENEKYLPPCQAHCPTGIPVQRRWELIRKGKLDEAVDLVLQYTPFPATVCGYLCPNLCMQHCTRQTVKFPALDVALLGKASLQARVPQPAPSTGTKVAVIGGGAAGLSVAWQLWMKGHDPVIFETREKLGGKITQTIPRDRIPDEVVEHELRRVAETISRTHLDHPLTLKEFSQLQKTYDFIVVAAGAQKPRMLSVPGGERAIAALDFLRWSKDGTLQDVGKTVVVIGAGNVGCDVACEASRLGAESVILIDIQEPASFGVERRHAEKAGAQFLWPRFTKAITRDGIELTTGEVLPADTVVVAVGDSPDLSFLPDQITRDRGFVKVNDHFQTDDPQVFAIGDSVRLGLLTEAIGAGRLAAQAIDDITKGRYDTYDQLPPIDTDRVNLEYYDPRVLFFDDPLSCAVQCASCGACRDCGLCETICPQNAISRHPLDGDDYEYLVNADRCIGCGFCADACPCGIWMMHENPSQDDAEEDHMEKNNNSVS
ncbi:MAG: FAD-dependent oxidoreductase [Syntrophales bacterium]|jgi:NADPH-dependent glutamate synthase beta subunit-like oxidoreductase/glutamate synthase domain-containing protein 3